jgi:hypothetical protein
MTVPDSTEDPVLTAAALRKETVDRALPWSTVIVSMPATDPANVTIPLADARTGLSTGEAKSTP